MDAISTKRPLLTIEDRLVSRYGELIELQELVELLRYPSALALKRAVERNAFGFNLTPIGSRKIAATRDVAKLLVASGFPERPGSCGEDAAGGAMPSKTHCPKTTNIPN